jgi:hypothetical protein
MYKILFFFYAADKSKGALSSLI